METILLIIHALLAIILIIVVLIQRAEGGALGIGGGSDGISLTVLSLRSSERTLIFNESDDDLSNDQIIEDLPELPLLD